VLTEIKSFMESKGKLIETKLKAVVEALTEIK